MSGFYGKTNASYEFENLVASQMNSKVNKLVKNMIAITPEDTGDLKKSYSVSKVNNFHYSIENDRTYAHQVLGLGRTGPGLGSLQLPDGILPFIKTFIEAEDN